MPPMLPADESPVSDDASGKRRRWRRAGLIAILMLGGAFSLVIPFAHAKTDELFPQVPRAADGAMLVPGTAEHGVLTITIPPGTAEAMAAGGRGYVLPPVIQLKRGDRIVIRNNDLFPHIMLFAFVMPGETTERTFNEVATETYSAGCTIDPTPNGFTSLFVRE
jgi:hypothetical protein